MGGGASGLACAVAAARSGIRVLVIEKMDRCGHKLCLTGGRKCNFTHEEPPAVMARRFESGARLLPLLRRFPYERIERFFGSLGIAARTDRDGCVWPVGMDAAGVRDRLVLKATEAGAVIRTSCRVLALEPCPEGWEVVLPGERVSSRSVCVATGGASFPQTGTTGDGLGLCRRLGLETAEWFAALASLETAEDLSGLAGITHPQVEIELVVGAETVQRASGHFIFAHRYVSGSTVLILCGAAARALSLGSRVKLRVNWLPGYDSAALASAFGAARREHPRRKLLTFLAAFMARRLGRLLCARADVPAERLMAELTREEERRVTSVLKGTEFEVVGTEPMERSTVTGGGVSLDEVDLETCRVRRFPGLCVTGELLDTWAETGGYNLHLAWATGIAVAEALRKAKG